MVQRTCGAVGGGVMYWQIQSDRGSLCERGTRPRWHLLVHGDQAQLWTPKPNQGLSRSSGVERSLSCARRTVVEGLVL